MIVILIGAPGAGKGTQAKYLSERHGFRQISTGEALRKQIKEGTALGKKVQAVMERGELVSDQILLDVLGAEVGHNPKEKIILDGYPRNVAQAKTLQDLDIPHKIKGAILIDVASQSLLERLTGRRVCQNCGANYHIKWQKPAKPGLCDSCGGALIQRADDGEDRVKVRLSIYQEQTKPVIDFYTKAGMLFRIDGNQDVAKVNQDLETLMGTLK